MEEEYLRYLRENNKALYDQAIESANWSVKWRDEEIAKLQAENKKLRSMLGEEFSPETCELICTDTKQLQAENVELRSKIERLRSDIPRPFCY